MNKHSMLDSSSPTALQRVISASHRLHSTFSPSVDDSRPIRLRGKRPQLGSAPRLPHLVSYIPDPEVRARIRHLVEMGIQRAEQTTQRVFRETIAQTVSIETLDGTSDFDVENMLCDCFEGILQRAVDKILDSVMKVVIKHATSFPQEGLRGNSTFSQHVVYILEQAYLHAQVLTQAECAIVAQRAGISHQQVRTWFQNKRNRKRGAERRTASASAVQGQVSEPAIPGPRRVISALPKRVAKTQEHLQLATNRPVRSLPRRGQQSQQPCYREVTSDESSRDNSPSPPLSLSRSLSSISDVSSVPENGGFINPLSLYLPPNSSQIGTQVVIPWQTAQGHIPNLDFTPPTPINQRTFGGYTDSPLDMMSNPFEDIDFGMGEVDVEALLRDLEMPMLSTSPSFSASEASNNGNMQAASEAEGGWQNQMEQEIMRVMGMLLDPNAPVVEQPEALSMTDMSDVQKEHEMVENNGSEQGLEVVLSTATSSSSSPTSELITPMTDIFVAQSAELAHKQLSQIQSSQEHLSMDVALEHVSSWATLPQSEERFDPSLFPYADCPIPTELYVPSFEYHQGQYNSYPPSTSSSSSSPKYMTEHDQSYTSQDQPPYTSGNQSTYMEYSSAIPVHIPVPVEYLPSAIPYQYQYSSQPESHDELPRWIGGVLPFDQVYGGYGLEGSMGDDTEMGGQGIYVH